MLQNKLGKSELQVSAVGLGCMSLHPGDAKAGIQIVQEAFDFGINYFDTADLYDRGENEVLVGKAVKSFRQEIVLATKVGNQWKDGEEGWTWNAHPDYIKKAVEDSLRRMQTDYIDLYQLHGGTNADNFEEVVDAFEQLKREGKIRYYGLSSIRPNVFGWYAEHSNIVSNMMQYSMLDTRPEEYFGLLERKEVGVIARGSLAQGLLLGKEITKGYLSHSLQESLAIKESCQEWARTMGVSQQTVALKYVLDHGAVSAAIVGVRTAEQLAELKQSVGELAAVAEERLANVPCITYLDHRS